MKTLRTFGMIEDENRQLRAEIERLRAALLAVVNGDYDIDAIPEEIWLQAKAALEQKADTE